MKLWKISQKVNNDYDTYSDAVVAAETAQEASMIHPSDDHENWDGIAEEYTGWCDVEDVKTELLGTAVKGTKKGVICASFHAG